MTSHCTNINTQSDFTPSVHKNKKHHISLFYLHLPSYPFPLLQPFLIPTHNISSIPILSTSQLIYFHPILFLSFVTFVSHSIIFCLSHHSILSFSTHLFSSHPFAFQSLLTHPISFHLSPFFHFLLNSSILIPSFPSPPIPSYPIP